MHAWPSCVLRVESFAFGVHGRDYTQKDPRVDTLDCHAGYAQGCSLDGGSLGVLKNLSSALPNFQILSPLDFLAEFTQHIPPKGSHLIRYYGWYSNKARGMRRKAEAAVSAAAAQTEPSSPPASRCSRTWAMLIKRVYEVDPLACPHCGGEMKVVAFIEPPQAEVIEQILRHCGLWQEPASRAPPDVEGLARDLDFGFSTNQNVSPESGQSQQPTYVDIDTFLATF